MTWPSVPSAGSVRLACRYPAMCPVIGFDNVPTGAFLSPPLSSVKEPVSEMIHEVINRLTAMLDGGYFSKR
ncbi:Cryptic asc operon repressor [Cedecea neteri]|uniref:Cryptic asc operon repressor n=1 Tax=Cedecea neteri TaxID=158822 RepID=A0A2X3J5J3_9ENTR|nr:Cryptic asc operon repressor [Cedecea neteri]